MDPRRRHRRFLAPFLAVTLAVELSVGALAVGPSTPVPPAAPPAAPAADQAGLAAQPELSAVLSGRYTAFHGGIPSWASAAGQGAARTVVPARPTPANSVPNVAIAATPKPAVAPKPVKAQAPKAAAPKAPAVATYRGRNHVWIPALGVSRSVSFYSCSRSTALANVVYRWGCGGSNNVYLMGHAWGVFRSLHNAYVQGRLRKGMLVIYADGKGRVTRYRVSFWKVVSPVGAGWAYAAQSRPSMTLQTCVGSRSQYRLVVRLVASS
jgi:sortase (surface protein transpeptidase)